MQQMVSRYRDRLQNSSSQLKNLSASRQKQTNLNESLKKSPTSKVQLALLKSQLTTSKLQTQLKLQTQSKLIQKSLPPRQQQKQQKQKKSTHNLKSSRKQVLSSTKSHQKLSRKTPKKNHIPTVTSINELYSESIVELITNEKNIYLINKNQLKEKIKIFFQQYYQKRLQISHLDNYDKNIGESNILKNIGLSASSLPIYQNPILSSSNIHPPTQTPSPLLTHFQSQLQSRLIQSQKQVQYYKQKLQSISKKYQQQTKQIQKFAKIQKLISNTVEMENQARKEVNRLRRELEVNQLKNVEQQKVFRRQIYHMKDMIEQLKTQLPTLNQIN